MKTKQLFLTGVFLVSALFANAQNNVSSATITSGGLNAGTSGNGNTFYGVNAGKPFPSLPVGVGNTFVGHYAGDGSSGSYNTFIGSANGQRAEGSYNVFIGSNVGGNSSSFNNRLLIENSANPNALIWGDFALDQLKFNGKVGVGYGFGDFPAMAGAVNVSAYNLFVNGGILTEEVRVMLKNDWADYVFAEDYNLAKLEEVEAFIKENKHLPNVPSAKEVAENGIELGEIATIQQEKIEELTLYIIEQNSINKEQAKQLEKQHSEIEVLKEQVKLLLESQNNTK